MEQEAAGCAPPGSLRLPPFAVRCRPSRGCRFSGPTSSTQKITSGLVAQQNGVTVTVFAFEVAGDRITHIWAVRNPDKLRPWMAG